MGRLLAANEEDEEAAGSEGVPGRSQSKEGSSGFREFRRDWGGSAARGADRSLGVGKRELCTTDLVPGFAGVTTTGSGIGDNSYGCTLGPRCECHATTIGAQEGGRQEGDSRKDCSPSQ